MNEYEMNNVPTGNPMRNEEQREGFTFKWINLVLGVAFCVWWLDGSGGHGGSLTSLLFLSMVVVIHELGHVVVGKSFGCSIKEMQVFFLPFVSYKPKKLPGGGWWRNITWSLGVLPLGGVTMFKSRGAQDGYGLTPAASPFIEDKPAWQRLLISAAGVLFNIATFLILYHAMPYMSEEWSGFFWPLTVMSLLLAVLNILPIYPLDGGAIVFALYEIVTGKKPSPKFTQVCGWIGFAFIVLFFWVFPGWLNGILDYILRLFF